jgi:excisionase family DNA binding protein
MTDQPTIFSAPTPRPFSPETLAARWDCSARSIERMCKLGKLRCFKVGRAYRIPADAVTEYESGSMNAASPSHDQVPPVAETVAASKKYDRSSIARALVETRKARKQPWRSDR